MDKKYFFIILLFFLCSCQNVKDALSGKKYENSDEFLVIKKNPLVLPPNFNDLPIALERKDGIEVNTAMSNAFGFGGTNACLVFRKI